MTRNYTFSAKSSRRKVKIILNETRHYSPSSRVSAFTLAMEELQVRESNTRRAFRKQLLSFLDNAKQTGKMSTKGGVYLLIDTFGVSKQFARSIMNEWVQSFKAQGGVS